MIPSGSQGASSALTTRLATRSDRGSPGRVREDLEGSLRWSVGPDEGRLGPRRARAAPCRPTAARSRAGGRLGWPRPRRAPGRGPGGVPRAGPDPHRGGCDPLEVPQVRGSTEPFGSSVAGVVRGQRRGPPAPRRREGQRAASPATPKTPSLEATGGRVISKSAASEVSDELLEDDQACWAPGPLRDRRLGVAPGRAR